MSSPQITRDRTEAPSSGFDLGLQFLPYFLSPSIPPPIWDTYTCFLSPLKKIEFVGARGL